MQIAAQSLTHAARAPRKVVVVDGNPQVLTLLEAALDGGRYDLLFANAGEHAYSLIKREQPDLVVLSVHIDEMGGFQLLSMLKLDQDTESIPVVTYTNNLEDADDDFDDEDPADLVPHVPLRLN